MRLNRLFLVVCALAGALQVGAQTNGVYRELWPNLRSDTLGNTLQVLTNTTYNPNWPDNPDPAYTRIYPTFETDTNTGMNNYGQRVRSYLSPPVSGPYTFWIASDDLSTLYLSTDENPANLQQIAFVSGWTSSEQWDAEGTQQSNPVQLTAGQRYLIEALHQQGGGGDNLAVAWQPPGASGPAVIPGSALQLLAAPLIVAEPANVSVVENAPATFTLGVGDFVPPSAQWQRGSTNLAGANGLTLTLPRVALSDSGAQFRCVISNAFGVVTSTYATLTVLPDTTPPTLANAYNLNLTTVTLLFSKPVDPLTATNPANYSLNPPRSIGSVTASGPQAVTLTVAPLSLGTNYVLTVNGVRDLAATPNVIAPNSTVAFVASTFIPAGIGMPSIPGSAAPGGNGFDITGGGAGVTVNASTDQFQFNYLPQNGDFDVQVRVQALADSNPFAEAGLMFRLSADPGSAFAGVFTTPSVAGTFFAARSSPGAAVATSGGPAVNYPNTWLRLRRTGGQFSGFVSYDGITWIPTGAAALATGPGLLGFAVAGGGGAQTIAQFRDYGPASSQATGNPASPYEPAGPSSRRTQWIFSEIMYRPAPRADGRNIEYIELYNSNPWWDDISGYTLSGSISYTFPPGTVVQGGGYLVVAASPSDVQAVYGITNVVGPYSGSLKKTGTLQLTSTAHGLLLNTTYDSVLPWPAGADGTGHSIILAKPSYGEADPRAWAISDVVGGSPGGPEAYRPSALRSVVINKFLANPAGSQKAYVELYNHSTSPVNVSGCILTDDTATNRFVIPSTIILPAGGHAAFFAATLGFAPNPAGGLLLLKTPDASRVLDAVSYEAQGSGVPQGRWPDGAADFYPLSGGLPGKPDATPVIGDVVINEIMYKPITGNTADQYVELYNKGTNSVDLTGWAFTAGISYPLPPSTILAPGAYLVVAADHANLLSKYTNLSTANTVGDFGGKLPSGGRLALARPDAYTVTNTDGSVSSNPILVVEDEVTYGTGGAWGQWAKGGGSSLELIDPNTNHRLAYNWADSDETRKSAWTNLTVTAKLDNGANYSSSVDLVQLGLLDVGELLVDNVSVVQGSSGQNLVANGDFESGLNNWNFQGDHVRSGLESSSGLGGYQSPHSLHLRSSDSVWLGANSAEAMLSQNSLGNATTATLSLNTRWLRGWNELLLRLHGNWLELTGAAPIPANLGTPGLPNSMAGTAGPAIYAVAHSPSIPPANQPVVVSAKFHSVAGLNPVLLYRIDNSLDPTPVYSSVPMADAGTQGDAIANDGIFSATIPAQPAGTVVAFLIQASNTEGITSVFPRPRQDNSGLPREGVICFGDPIPTGAFGHYHLWMTQNWRNRWNTLGGLSNEENDATLVDGGGRIIYNVGGRYAGSPYHQYNGDPATSLGGHAWNMPDDDLFLGTSSFHKQHVPGNSTLDDATLQREQTSYWMARQLRVPWANRRYYSLYINGNKLSPLMEDSQVPEGDYVKEYFPDDDNGYLFKNNAWFEFQPQNQNVIGMGFNNNSWSTLNRYNTTISGVGVVPKLARYRWCYEMKQSPGSDNDYSPIYALIQAANTVGTGYYQAMESLVDTEEYLQMSALEHATGDWDSYVTQNQWNMYSYKPLNGKFTLLKWDWNIELGNSGSWGPDAGNLFTIDGSDPVMSKFQNYAPYSRAFLRSLQTIANVAMNNTYANPVLDAKYAAFQASGLGSSAAEPGANGLKSWIGTMHNSIMSTLLSHGVLNVPFALSGPTNLVVGTTNVYLSGTAPLNIRTITVSGLKVPITWSTAKNWSMTVTALQKTNNLILQGFDANGDILANEVLAVQIVNTNAPDQRNTLPIRINEWMAGNATTILDPADGKSEDWFELYNPNLAPFDLSGYYLSHHLTNDAQFPIPAGIVMPALGYILVWADKGLTSANDGGNTYIHANFGLSAAKGGEIALFDPSGNLIDAISFGPQMSDISQGRYPDGGPLVYSMSHPTPAAANFFANSPPTLDPLADQNVTVGATISFTASGADPDVPPQTLTYSLGTNAPAGAAIDSVSGLFTWTTTEAATNTVTVYVSDNGTPPLSANRSFVAAVAAAPPANIQLLPPAFTSGSFTITWEALSSQTYRLQFKTNLLDLSWTDVPGDIPATGVTASKTDSFGTNAPHRFYRVITIP